MGFTYVQLIEISELEIGNSSPVLQAMSNMHLRWLITVYCLLITVTCQMIMPAPTVSLVNGSTKITLPVCRFSLYGS